MYGSLCNMPFKLQKRDRSMTTLSLTSEIDRSGWLTPCPGHFISRKDTRYPLYRTLVGPQSRSGRVRKILPTRECDPRADQSVASRYTNWAIPVNNVSSKNMSKFGTKNPDLFTEKMLYIYSLWVFCCAFTSVTYVFLKITISPFSSYLGFG